MYFKRFEDFKPQYPEDIKAIREYLESVGELKCTDKELDDLWSEFSEDYYCAGWMTVTDKLLEQFADFLESK